MIEDKERIRGRIKGVETAQVDIPTTKIQVKLLFKYLEFVAEFGKVGIAE